MSFGKRVCTLRKENNLTQKQFSEVLNLSTTTIASWEKDVKKPSFEVLIMISKKFNISLDWLCETDSENELKIKTWADIVKMLYSILSCEAIPKNIAFCSDDGIERCSLSFAKYLSEPEVLPPNLFSDEYFETTAPTENTDEEIFTFENPVYEFIDRYCTMKKLLENHDIDKEIFDMWLVKSFEKYNKYIRFNKKAGEPNGNDNEAE